MVPRITYIVKVFILCIIGVCAVTHTRILETVRLNGEGVFNINSFSVRGVIDILGLIVIKPAEMSPYGHFLSVQRALFETDSKVLIVRCSC